MGKSHKNSLEHVQVIFTYPKPNKGNFSQFSKYSQNIVYSIDSMWFKNSVNSSNCITAMQNVFKA